MTKHYSEKTGYITNNGYRHVCAKGHPLANPNQANPRVLQHRLALYDKIGPGPHECHWGCGTMLVWNGTRGSRGDYLEADHIDGDKLNNVKENLVPSCHWCNSVRVRTRKLSRNDARRIREVYANGGVTLTELANTYTVAVSTIHEVVKGRIYVEV